MKMRNKSFIVLLIAATIMVIGVIAENTLLIINPEKVEVKTDTNEVKNKLRKAGLIPHDALHWKEL